jgi:PhnB protein
MVGWNGRPRSWHDDDARADARESRVNPEWNNAILHARISSGDAELMAADIPNAEPMRSAYLTLRLDSEPEAERVFSALSDRGQVLMPMQETFFACRFGQVRDRFGINWMILHERPMPPHGGFVSPRD